LTVDALVVWAGFALRLVLPVALTLAAGWLLRRLDARWQADAAASAPARRVGPVSPCWIQHQCSAERRAACPVFGQTAVPCWQFFRDARGNLRADCLTCDVLKQAPAPVLWPA
jgi:hypothetical protein